MASTAEGPLAIGGASDFRSLEDKIYRTIELLKEARAQKATAEMELATLRETFDAQAAQTEQLRAQLQSLQAERAQARERIEQLIAAVDSFLKE